jgi:7-carboxy-7-deazaguanine synthase
MKVSEIFHSIQGEGVNAGVPSVFLRLALCNLRCTYCDTKYTWDWDNHDYHKEVKMMSVEEVRREIAKFDCNHLVLTGGEPMVQQKELGFLLSKLKQDKGDLYIEVETNGTILPNEILIREVSQWNVSPKLSNSGNPIAKREIARCYNFFAHELKNAYFKFVVRSRKDVGEVEELVQKYRIPVERVQLMPLGTTKTALNKRSKWVIEICETKGFRYSPRLHIQMWGNKRGA